MVSENFWSLCALLCWATVQGKQYDLPVPEIVNVSYANKFGDLKMNLRWKDNFININKPKKVTYDLEIYHTEQMQLVHNETLEVKPDPTGNYTWSWTSPLPLQCTSHSVRLRYRNNSLTSDWTPLFLLKGQDASDSTDTVLYPNNHLALVGESIIFCCILKPEKAAGFNSSDFKIRISNRTFVKEPVKHNKPSETGGINIRCEEKATTYFIGYAPDDQNLTCETRDLSSVECHWDQGRFVGEATPFNVNYSINGRHCYLSQESKDKHVCTLDKNINEGKTNWTLRAKNSLGEKILTDTADMKYRVRLQAPRLAHAVLVHARNATLEWQWNNGIFHSFPMICQVELNEHIIKETFHGNGLQSVFLTDLQPFKMYTARVRCGSQQHFYKWGDWSKPISFTTDEDIPDAIDVWMQVLDQGTYVIWKNPNVNQSHGIINGYELLLGSPTSSNRQPIRKASNEHCHNLNTGNAERDFISVSVRNSKGVSTPSSVVIPSPGSDSGIITTPISGHNGGFNLSWEPNPNSSCGYVVDWFPTYNPEKCSVKWKKTPFNELGVTDDADFKNGVKYTLSVYACTSGAPQLLQRRTGYMKELSPSGKVQNLKLKLQGSDVVLSWEEVPEEQQKGVILGYNVSYKLFSKSETIGGCQYSSVNKKEPPERVCRLQNLPPGDYTFKVRAFTSAGEGPDSEISSNVTLQAYTLVVSILTALGITACIIAIITVCSTKREWLKSKFYPDIPKPQLSEQWFKKGLQQYPLIDKLLLSEKEVFMAKNPEACLQIVPLKEKKGHEKVELLSSEPPQATFSSDTFDSKTESVTFDPSYIDVPCPCIQNPTYNLPLSFPAEANLVLGYHPQIQNVDYQLQASNVPPVQVDSDYQPQSTVSMNPTGVTNDNILPINSSLVSSPDYLLHNTCR